MALIMELNIVLGARTEKLDNGLDRSTARVRKFESDVGKIGKAAEATLAPIRDLGLSMLSVVPGAAAAANAFSAIAAAFATGAAAKVAKETRETAAATAQGAAAMGAFATAATAAAVATSVIRGNVSDVPRIGSAMNRGIAVYNPRTARAGAGKGADDAIDAEFTVLSRSTSGIGGVSSALGGVSVAGVAAGAAVAAAFVGIASAAAAAVVTIRGVREQMTEIDNVSDSAKKLGMSFSELATSRFALGESSGLDTAAIDASLQKMQLGLAEARSGTGALAGELRAMGLDAGRLLEVGPVEALKEISAKTIEMKNPTDQMKLAFDLFGKSGVALVSSLREGPDAMIEAAKAAEELNLTLTQTQAEQVGAANDAWDRVYAVGTGVFRQIAAEVAPLLAAIGTNIQEVARSFKGWEKVLPTIVDFLAVGAGHMWDLAEAVKFSVTWSYKLLSLDFAGLSKDAANAFDFGTGQNLLKQTYQMRAAAAEAANAQRGGGAIDVQAFEEAEASTNKLTDATKAAKQAVADRLQGMRDEIALLGKTADEVERLKFARDGADEPQQKEFALNQKRLNDQRELDAAIERGRQLREQYRSPAEEFQFQMSDLSTLLDVGAIDLRTFSEAAKAAKRNLMSAETNRIANTPTVAALQRGSVAAYSQGNKNEQSMRESAVEKSNELLTDLKVEMTEMNRRLGTIQTVGKI